MTFCQAISVLNNTAAVLVKQNRYGAAEKSLKSALRLARQERCRTIIQSVAFDSVISNASKLLSTLETIVSDGPSTYRSEYDEGMDHFDKLFHLGASSKYMESTILFNSGRTAHDQGNMKDALNFYRESFVMLESIGIQNDPLTVANLCNIGKVLYILEDHEASLQIYTAALTLAISVFGADSLEVAVCLNCIGILHYVSSHGDKDVGLKSLIDSLKVRQGLQGSNHIDVGTVWNNIGRFLFRKSNYDRAIKSYNEALRIRQLNQADSVDVAATIFNMGQVHHILKNLNTALQLYQDFLELTRNRFGENHRDICMVTLCIGQVYHEMNDSQNAMDAFQNSLRVGHAVLGPMHSELGIILNQLGNVHYESGDFECALKIYHEGLAVELAALDVEEGNQNICVTYTNIAEIHRQRSEYSEALKFYQKLFEFQSKYNVENLEIANTLSNIGYIKHQKRDFEGSLEVNQECLRLRRDTLGDGHEDVATTLTHIAIALIEMERRDLALETLGEAYRIWKVTCGSDSRDLAFTLYNIALIHHREGDNDRALKFYLETSRVENAVLGDRHRDLSVTYFNIGQIYSQRGEVNLALENFKKALEVEHKCFGRNHPTCARTLNEIGNMELNLGNVKGLMTSYSDALRIYKKAGISQDNLIVYGQRLWRFDLVQPKAAAMA